MADQTFEHNNGRPHHNTGEIGDFLNSLPDREYWAAHGMWYQKPESQDRTFEEHVREADAERREQAMYDDANAARSGGSNPSPRSPSETHPVRSESPDSVLSDDSLYHNPSPRRGDRGRSSDNHRRGPEDEGPDEGYRQTEMPTVHAVMPGGFETDALDDEALSRLLANPPPELTHQARVSQGPDPHHGDALDDAGLARLLANPPPEMLKQGISTPVPGALDDDALEALLAKQQEEIYEGGWRDLIGDTSSADQLSDQDLERFLANERDRVVRGETEAFPAVQQHPDALDDEDLAKVIASLGFEQRPSMQPQRGQSSRSPPTISQTRDQFSGYRDSSSPRYAPDTSRPAPPALRMTPPLDLYPNTATGPSQIYGTPLSPISPNGSSQSFNDQLANRRRRMDEQARREEEAAELERIREELQAAAAVREGKQPERYHE